MVPVTALASPQAERLTPLSERIAVSPRQAAVLLGISVQLMYDLLNSEAIPSVKAGQRRLISTTALRTFMERR